LTRTASALFKQPYSGSVVAFFEPLLNENPVWFASHSLYSHHTPRRFQALLTTGKSLIAVRRYTAVTNAGAYHEDQYVNETAH
jgi:hypothetical protein